jgi:glycosyltransferase involved in cell wall biosynthesis
MPLLSIVVPAYNEGAFIHTLLERIVAVPVGQLGFEKEIVVVNDGSKDDTEAIARRFAASCTQVPVRVFNQVPNQGKGKAVQRGIRESSGDYILIQDADLEYDPNDYLTLLETLKHADVVYGSRTLGQARLKTGSKIFPGKHPEQGLGAWTAGVLLTLWTLLLYGRWITDTLTAYKLYPAGPLKQMKLRTSGFETDHEITAKLIRRGLSIRARRGRRSKRRTASSRCGRCCAFASAIRAVCSAP